MSVSRGLKRLFEVRALEEELSQAALEEAIGRQRLLEAALRVAEERERRGRLYVTSSANSADAVDRIAGFEEAQAAIRRAALIKPRIVEAEREVVARQAEFLAKRMRRRQVETLIQKIEATQTLADARRAQQEMDDRFLSVGNGEMRKVARRET